LQKKDHAQTIGELVAANVHSSKRPVALLTDFITYQYYWIGQELNFFKIYTTIFTDSYEAASFARLLLLTPEQLAKKKISENFPSFEKRVTIEPAEPIYYNDDDIGDLGDFQEEMTPEERIAYEVTKKFSKIRPFIPHPFRD